MICGKVPTELIEEEAKQLNCSKLVVDGYFIIENLNAVDFHYFRVCFCIAYLNIE